MREAKYSTNPEFDELLRKMGQIHDAKRADYANNDPLGNFREAERVGVTVLQGIMVRLGDKYTRACNLVRQHGERAVKDETLEDTLLDLANYALLALLAYRREKEPHTCPECGSVLVRSVDGWVCANCEMEYSHPQKEAL